MPSQGIEVEPTLIYIDLPVMVATTIACVPISGRRITRLEGMVFVGAYITYLT